MTFYRIMKKKAKTKDNENKVFIYSNACERRSIDAKKICTYITNQGYEIVNDPKYANYIILVTCGFVESVSDRCLELIKEFQEYNAELIVAGCLVDIIPDKVKQVFDGRMIPTKNLDSIDDIFKDAALKFSNLDDEHTMWYNFDRGSVILVFKSIVKEFLVLRRMHNWVKENTLKKLFGENFDKTFPFNRIYPEKESYCISISRGCIHNCSYCAIRKAVGKLKSKPLDQCIKEFKIGLSEGHTHFVLEADDVGHYGIDIKSSLPELLDTMTNIDGDYIIELKNFHPMWIIRYADEFEKILKRKKLKIILLSIQSGNDRILKLMRRSYKINDLITTMSRLKNADPDLKLGVHLMVGFPSETNDEFNDTLKLFDKVQLDFGSIFSFSSQEGTDADAMEPKLTKSEMRKRMRHALKFLRKKNYFAWYSGINESISFYKK